MFDFDVDCPNCKQDTSYNVQMYNNCCEQSGPLMFWSSANTNM